MARFRVDVFGGVRASVAGVALPPLPARTNGLLALLVLARGRTVGTTELVEWLWGTDAVPSAGNQLQRLVGHARRHFEPDLPARAAGAVILAANDGYRLGDDVASDLFDLDDERAEEMSAGALAASALRVVRQPPFAGLEVLLADHPSYVAVERQCAGIAMDALDLVGASAADRDVVDLVQAVAVRFPFEERLQAGLIRALGAVGRRSDAMALYERVRTALLDELGVDPGPELRSAHIDLLGLDEPVPHNPAVREQPPVVSQLPRMVGGLVSRPAAQRLLDRVADLGEAGTVLVTAIGGMGGVGKTTLAVAWAHQLAPRFPDGQLYLNLRGYDATGDIVSTEEAVGTLLTALGATAGSGAASLDAQLAQLHSRLAGHRYLLLLDNARDADHVRPLLPSDPGCLVIVTSRDRLTSLVTRDGAVPVQLDRMSDEEAAELLARRLGIDAVRADPVATRDVLRACGGLPLALALVATRVALEPRLTLGDVSAELRDTDLAAWSAEVGSEDLRAVFALSFASLDPSTTEAFQLIGAHPAGHLSMASLVSLLGRPRADCAHALRRLGDASLLHQVDREHFALHDLLRAYAHAMPDPDGRVTAAEHRLVDHFVHTARNAAITQGLTMTRAADEVAPGITPESFAGATAAHLWYPVEHEAITAVIGLTLRRGWTRDAANITIDLSLLAARRGATPGQHAQALWTILAAAGGLDSDEAFNDPALLADVLCDIALHQRWFGTVEQAEVFLDRAKRIVTAGGDRLATAQVLRAVGQLRLNQGEFDSAQQAFDEALRSATGDEGAAIRVRVYSALANLYEARGNWPASLDANDHALAIETRQRTEGTMLIIGHINRAECLVNLGRPHEALDAIASSRAAGAESSTYLASLLLVQARAALDAGDVDLTRRAVDEFRTYMADPSSEGAGAEWLGGTDDLHHQIDEIDRALTAASG